MSYHIYTTKGLVLSYRPRGEADRVYSILTRDFGLVRATALGVRKETSKLRGALEPITIANVSLVKGKDHWRITSSEEVRQIKDKSYHKPLVLLEQLIPGESAHSELYDAVEKFLSDTAQDEMFEVRLVAHILFHLGYLEGEDLTLSKRALVEKINKGIEASQLTRN